MRLARADAAFEAVRHHAGAAADVAFRHRPLRAPSSAAKTCALVTCWPCPSFRNASEVSPTTGWCHGISLLQRLVEPAVDGIAHDADRVGAGDHHRAAEHAALDHPGRAGHLAKAVAGEPCRQRPAPSARPRGRMAVTPVRTGPVPTTSGPSPRTIVVWPTSTPATSVMALSGPGHARERHAERARPGGCPARQRHAAEAARGERPSPPRRRDALPMRAASRMAAASRSPRPRSDRRRRQTGC